MSVRQARLEFAPTPAGAGLGSMALALLVHALLLAALAWGVRWHHAPPTLAVTAELWAALPQQAAPAPEAPPPADEPVAPIVPAQPAPPTPAEIAQEREHAQRLERQRREQELLAQAEREQVRRAMEVQRLADESRRRQDAEKQALARSRAQQEKAAAKALEKQRQDNLARLTALAGAAATPASSGNAAQSAGPSAGYAARVSAAVRPKIVFTENIASNAPALVEVRCAPDGSIVGRKLLKSSGNPAWDEAVLKAIDKTERLPRDTDGRVFPLLEINFRPKD